MATVTIKHASLTGAAANPAVLVDGPKWDASHTVTGLENVANVDTTNASNLTSGTVPAARMPALTGDITTTAGAVATTLATVNGNVGAFGSTTKSVTVTFNAKGLATAASESTVTPAVGSITGLGTGVATALAINVGSAGAPVTFNGAIGTPSSGTLTNTTGFPVGQLANVGANVVTALAVNVGSAGAFVVNGGVLGTPSSGTATNLTGLPLTTAVTGVLPIANGGTNSSGGAVVTVKKQVFTASGTYTPSTGLLYCIVECVGAGGGGGGTATTAANAYAAGGGGGGGGYSRITLTAASVGGSQVVTIGAAGAAGTSGNNAGGTGGTTSLGALCSALGGGGGTGNSGSSLPAGGAGGNRASGVGDLLISGQTGQSGTTSGTTGVFIPSGAGGSSGLSHGYGSAGLLVSTSTTGTAGSLYGGAGSGGATYNATGAAAGGAGTTGLIYIQEFCNQ